MIHTAEPSQRRSAFYKQTKWKLRGSRRGGGTSRLETRTVTMDSDSRLLTVSHLCILPPKEGQAPLSQPSMTEQLLEIRLFELDKLNK